LQELKQTIKQAKSQRLEVIQSVTEYAKTVPILKNGIFRALSYIPVSYENDAITKLRKKILKLIAHVMPNANETKLIHSRSSESILVSQETFSELCDLLSRVPEIIKVFNVILFSVTCFLFFVLFFVFCFLFVFI
jgi:hydroxymethylpyrimidine/phosphomethylpyrimidine kinase